MDNEIDARTMLIGLAIKYKGDWNSIYEGINNREYPDEEMKKTIKNMKCKAVTMLDNDYPKQLKDVLHPPFVLFYYGNLSLIKNYHNNISIVGSRKCSMYGSNITREIAGGLAEKGYTIISGLALGIDAIAHSAALEAKGRTVAVLGCGPDICYLKDNIDIYKKIREDNHLVISEYPEGTQPEMSYFPIRNRIIAGLSKTVVITEAYAKSGSLVTAALTLRGSGSLMCVPYPVGAQSECNRLIMLGAYLVESAEDVVNQMSDF